MKMLTYLVLSLAAAALACERDSPVECNCPNAGSSIPLPSDISARVISAVGDTCTAELNGGAGYVNVYSSGERPCRVTIQLDDGTVRESAVTFTRLGGCCGSLDAVSGTPFTMTFDGGSD